jgi:hypothetical protein
MESKTPNQNHECPCSGIPYNDAPDPDRIVCVLKRRNNGHYYTESALNVDSNQVKKLRIDLTAIAAIKPVKPRKQRSAPTDNSLQKIPHPATIPIEQKSQTIINNNFNQIHYHQNNLMVTDAIQNPLRMLAASIDYDYFDIEN